MAEDDPDRDEEWFKEVYGKEYTGPVLSAQREGNKQSVKRAAAEESDEDGGPRDPNAVPTDFTSREAKVWEAKAKAIERNWKRRKEEELYCKICGEPGHFAQGCPTTLGGNRKSREIVERVPLKDKRLKPRLIGTGGSVIQGIEKDTGCRLKLEDNHSPGHGVFYVRVSGPDRLTVCKAVNTVKKLVEQFEEEWNITRRPHKNAGSNPVITAQMEHIQRLQQSSNGGSLRADEERLVCQLESERDWGAVNGSRSAKSRDHFRGRSQDNGSYTAPRRQGYEPEMNVIPETLEELEQRFLQEALELSKEQRAEEDREISRHRECLREIEEQYQQKMMNLRAKQSRQRDEFLHHQVRHHQYYQQPPSFVYEGSQFVPGAYAFSQHAYEYAGPHHRKQMNDRSFEAASYAAAAAAAAGYGRSSPAAYQRHL